MPWMNVEVPVSNEDNGSVGRTSRSNQILEALSRGSGRPAASSAIIPYLQAQLGKPSEGAARRERFLNAFSAARPEHDSSEEE
jgi:hypothetical protein